MPGGGARSHPARVRMPCATLDKSRTFNDLCRHNIIGPSRPAPWCHVITRWSEKPH